MRYIETSSASSTTSEKYKMTLFPGESTHEVSKSVVSETTGQLFVCYLTVQKDKGVNETVFMRYTRAPNVK